MNKKLSLLGMKRDPDVCTSLSVTCGAVGGSEAAQAVWPVQRGVVERRRAARGRRQSGGGRGGRGQAAPVLLEDNSKEDTRVTQKNTKKKCLFKCPAPCEFSSPPQSYGSVTYSHPPWSRSLSSLPVSPCLVFPSLLSRLLEAVWGDCDRWSSPPPGDQSRSHPEKESQNVKIMSFNSESAK